MFYSKFEVEPNLYENLDFDDMQSSISFEHFSLDKKSNSDSFSFNSNDFNSLYYIRTQPRLGLEEVKEDPSPKEKEKENPNKVIERTKTTDYKTLLPVVYKKVEKELVFIIKKVKKSFLGRKRKNHFPNKHNNDNEHTKEKEDLMLTKLKRYGYNNTRRCLNYKLSKSHNENLKNIKLLKIDNSVITVSKKEENQALFQTKLKDLFSNKISKKYLYNDPDHNKKAIDYILQQNDKEIKALLDKTFGYMTDIYVDKKKEIIKGFTKLKDDKDFIKKNNDEKYIKLFTDFAINYKENIKKIFPRRKRHQQPNDNSLNN